MICVFEFGEYSRLTDEEKKEYQSLANQLTKIQSKLRKIENRTFPICIRINSNYLNTAYNDGTINTISWSSDGEYRLSIGKYSDLYAAIDNSINTYEFVFREV